MQFFIVFLHVCSCDRLIKPCIRCQRSFQKYYNLHGMILLLLSIFCKRCLILIWKGHTVCKAKIRNTVTGVCDFFQTTSDLRRMIFLLVVVQFLQQVSNVGLKVPCFVSIFNQTIPATSVWDCFQNASICMRFKKKSIILLLLVFHQQVFETVPKVPCFSYVGEWGWGV